MPTLPSGTLVKAGVSYHKPFDGSRRAGDAEAACNAVGMTRISVVSLGDLEALREIWQGHEVWIGEHCLPCILSLENDLGGRLYA